MLLEKKADLPVTVASTIMATLELLITALSATSMQADPIFWMLNHGRSAVILANDRERCPFTVAALLSEHMYQVSPHAKRFLAGLLHVHVVSEDIESAAGTTDGNDASVGVIEEASPVRSVWTITANE